MADIEDIVSKGKQIKQQERIAVDGMCGECYFPMDYGLYDPVNKKMTLVCVKEHESVIDWEFLDG